MELPDDVLQLIREYSKPVTNPNWRNRQWICVGDLYKDILRQDIYDTPRNKIILYQRFINNVRNDNHWDDLNEFRKQYGMNELSKCYGINIKVCHDIFKN